MSHPAMVTSSSMHASLASPPVKNVLVLTSTFPRWQGDKDPPFVHELCRRLAETCRIMVLAPHAPGAKTREVLEGIGARVVKCWRMAAGRQAEGYSPI